MTFRSNEDPMQKQTGSVDAQEGATVLPLRQTARTGAAGRPKSLTRLSAIDRASADADDDDPGPTAA